MPVKTPLPFAGHVDDVAAAAVFLASDCRGSSPARRSTSTAATSRRAAGAGRADGAWVTGRARTLTREVRRRARRAQPALPRRGDARGGGARLRVGVASRAPGVHPHDEPLAASGRGPSAGPARHADLRRVRVPRVSSRRAPSGSGSAPTCTTSALRHPFTRRAACRPSTSSRAVASSSASARRGSKRSGSRPSSTSRPGRRVDEAIEVCKRLGPRRPIAHHGEFFYFDGVVFEPKPVQRRGRRSSSAGVEAALAAAACSATDGSAWATLRVGAAAQIDASRAARGATGRSAGARFQIVLGGPVTSRDDVADGRTSASRG